MISCVLHNALVILHLLFMGLTRWGSHICAGEVIRVKGCVQHCATLSCTSCSLITFQGFTQPSTIFQPYTTFQGSPAAYIKGIGLFLQVTWSQGGQAPLFPYYFSLFWVWEKKPVEIFCAKKINNGSGLATDTEDVVLKNWGQIYGIYSSIGCSIQRNQNCSW